MLNALRHTTCSGKERENRARAQYNGARARNRIEAILTQYLFARDRLVFDRSGIKTRSDCREVESNGDEIRWCLGVIERVHFRALRPFFTPRFCGRANFLETVRMSI
jgi:hypothetical protein